MADISIKRTHALGLKGAKVAADKMAEKLGEKFDLAGDWDGHTLEFQRPGVNGSLSITETHMTLEVSLGFMLKMMKGPIENAVHEQLDKVLAAPTKSPAKSVPKVTVAKKTTAKKPAARKK
jgi:putative polyhydroxyalkanoate system protein